MTKSEKRYFKLQPMQEDSNHKILFDLLENQREYNEEKLLIALKGTGIELALSLAKNRLYHFLLKTLASFHTKSDAHAEVQRHIQGISVLLKRELADQAHKLLNSVYKICEKNEILHLLPELFRLEENCINQLPIQQHERLELLKDLEIRRGNALAKMIEINQFGKLKTDLLLIHYSEGQIRTPEHMNTLVSITTELEQSESNSTESLLKKLQIQAFLATEIGKKREALNFLNDIIVLLQKEGNSRQLFTTIANKAVLHAQLNEKTETFKALDELAKFPQFQLYASTFLTVCIELEENDRAWNEIQNWLEQDLLSARAQHIRTAHLFFQAAIVAFKKKEFKWAEKFTFKIIQEFPQNEGLHLLSITHLFYLVIQIELKNERFMPYALRNVQRFLQTRHRQFEPEKKLLQFVNELLKKRKSIGALSPWQWLSQELQKLKSSDPRFFSYFNFLEWAESKILKGI